ncbi:MAG: hypothetical protein OEW75_06390 [Cyclobacteriaceae bacterium]|nr:hypothetical protein [Cyclobacteriaceae bacterium]
MKHLPLYLIFFFGMACSTTNKEAKFNAFALAQELDSMYILDQYYRAQIDTLVKLYGWNSPEMNNMWEMQLPIDTSNYLRVQEIIDDLGAYPGKSIVGDTTCNAAFYILQHSPDSIQALYIDLILKGAIDNELDRDAAAMYHDRYLMRKGENQIYGSQIKIDQVTYSLTGEKRDSIYLWPIADTTNIDSLRIANGMIRLEEYLNHFGLSRDSTYLISDH